MTLDSGRLSQALGYQPLDPWPADDRLVPNNREWHLNGSAEITGTPELLAEVLYRNPSQL